MTDYAELVTALYRHYGTWRGVAKACGVGSAALYWKIAGGEIKRIKRNVKTAIREAVFSLGGLLPTVTSPPRDLQRKNVSYSFGLYKQMLALKNKKNETWEKFGEEALKARLFIINNGDDNE